MPIYAYRCSTCGYAKDVLQKMSDPVLTVCPECGASTFLKQVTAAGFQLKGSGWYVTDFRGGDKGAPAGDKGEKGDKGETGDKAGAKGDAPADAGKPAGGGEGAAAPAGKAESKATGSPAAAPAPTPTAAPPASGTK